MARLIETPTIVAAAGHPPKRIEEFIGRASTGSAALSTARMVSPPGWAEPGQTPDFDEYTLVLRGALQAEPPSGTFVIRAGQAFLAERGEWMRYSTPGEDGAERSARPPSRPGPCTAMMTKDLLVGHGARRSGAGQGSS